VRINDRGPFHKGRVIDVSYTAAHKLGFATRGSGRVRVESVEPDAVAAADSQPVYLQVGAFSQADNARQMRDQLRDRLSLETHRLHVVSSGDLHRVQLGPYASEGAAEPDLQRLKEQMELKPVLVRRD